MMSSAVEREILVKEFIKKATVAPSDRFGRLVMDVDHKKLSEMIRVFRLSKRVRAVNVGRELGFTRVQMHFLEDGTRKWTLELLRNYLKAVFKLAKGHEKAH